jgi:hypothetical protein
MRSALAPKDGIRGRVLRTLLVASVELSRREGESSWGPSSPGANFRLFRHASPHSRCAMSAAAAVLPFVWAFAREQAELKRKVEVPAEPIEPRMAFYRKYTEALLRKYVRMSTEAGKVPSLLKREMFRGKVTSYRVGNFDDVVIFLHDIDRCLEQLEPEQQDLISRIALQQYTVPETSEILDLPPRTTVRRYGIALDRLTRIFLNVKMLEPQNVVKG